MEIRQKNKIIRNGVTSPYPIFSQKIETYVLLFNEIPFTNSMSMSDANGRKYFEKIMNQFNGELITAKYDYEKYEKPKPDIMIGMDAKNKIMFQYQNYRNFTIMYPKTISKKVLDKYMELTRGHFDKPKKKRKPGRIYILTIKGTGKKARMQFSPFKLDKFTLSVEKNYNDDFLPKHKEIVRRLNEKDGNGIAILHGEWGTGKTFYLKQLCKTIKKKIIYIPPAMVSYIIDPFFIQMLGRHKNSVLVIEDADNVLRKRDERSDAQDVSSILNIADGMLSDVLRLQIVATFNTKLENIDDAFLRKGRLIAEHRFEKLHKKKAQALSNELGFETKIKEDMTLADIYNQNMPTLRDTSPKRKTVGFGNNS